jgi:hypothetical protein
MRRVWLVASREFLAAVANKGFVIGLLAMPAIFAGLTTLLPRMLSTQGEQIRGEVRVIDPTNQMIGGLRTALMPDAITRRRLESTRRALDNAPEAVRDMAGSSTNAMERAIGVAPSLTLVERPADADLQVEKAWLTEPPPLGALRHLALVVIHPNVVTPNDGATGYGTYDIYVPQNTDERIETTFHDGFREAVLSARVRAQNMNREQVEAVMRVPRTTSVSIAYCPSPSPGCWCSES